MSGARLTAALECANDAGVRFTLRRPGDSHGASRLSAGAAASCASADRPASAVRAAPSEAVATPQSEGLVRVRRQVCLRTPAPVPSGSLPANYPYAGRRFSAASRRRSTSSPAPCPSGYRTSPSKAGAAMGGAAAHAAKPGMRPSWAPKEGGRSGHGRKLRSGIAAPATVVQPQSSQRHTEPLAHTSQRWFRAHAPRCRCARAVRHGPPVIGGQDRPPEPLSTRLQNNLPIIAPDS